MNKEDHMNPWASRSEHPYRLSRNRRGVVEFPFKILIVAVVLVITVPLILSGLEKYSRRQQYNQVEQQVTRLENAIIQVYSQGENASLALTVEFPDSTEYVRLGGKLVMREVRTGQSILNPLSSIIYYRMRDDPEKTELVESSTRSIPISNSEGDEALELSSGRSGVILTKLFDPSIKEFFVMATYREV